MDSPARSAIDLLERERALLAGMEQLLLSIGAPEDTRRRVSELAVSLDELFLLVVAGEFNAGKSTLVNALFGRRVMEEGPVPTTDKITVLRHADADEVHRRSEFVTERRLPHPLLEHLAIVDTPGTNSIIREHQALTEDFVPRADLVLFVTSYDRPLSESERQFLNFIRGAWRKQLVVAVNKADLAETEEALAQVLAHVRDGLTTILGADSSARPPLVFPVAARKALLAKEAAGPDADASVYRADPRWEESRFGPFERFLTETLTADARISLKLAGPLDATETLLADAEARIAERSTILLDDDEQLTRLRERFSQVRTALDDVTARATAEIDRELLEMESRGGRFLDDTIRLTRVKLLRDRNAFREEFSRQVIRDSEARIEARLGEAADAILRRVYDLWNETYARLADLRKAPSGSGSGFLYDRDEVLRDVLRSAKSRVDAYDMQEEARRLLENARSALTVGGATAVGLGAAAAVLIAATAFDVTGGILAVGAAATLGLIVLPFQRRRAVREFAERVSALRTDLRTSLENAFRTEADSAIARVSALLQPVETLVESQRAKINSETTARERLVREAADIRDAVGSQFGAPVMEEAAPAE